MELDRFVGYLLSAQVLPAVVALAIVGGFAVGIYRDLSGRR